MKQLVIRIFDTQSRELQTTVTVPLRLFQMAAHLIPASAVAALRAQGLEVKQIQNALSDQVEAGLLLEVERPDRRVVVAIEQTAEGLIRREGE